MPNDLKSNLVTLYFKAETSGLSIVSAVVDFMAEIMLHLGKEVALYRYTSVGRRDLKRGYDEDEAARIRGCEAVEAAAGRFNIQHESRFLHCAKPSLLTRSLFPWPISTEEILHYCCNDTLAQTTSLWLFQSEWPLEWSGRPPRLRPVSRG